MLHHEPKQHAKTRKYVEILTAGKYLAGKILVAPKTDFSIFKDPNQKKEKNAQRER